MNIGLLTFGQSPKINEYRAIIENKLSGKGHRVKTYNGNTDIQESLASNKHLIFLADSGSFSRPSSSKELQRFLKRKGELNVKYGSFFMTDKLFPGKSFLKMMALLEEYGIILVYSDIVKNTEVMSTIAESLSFEV